MSWENNPTAVKVATTCDSCGAEGNTTEFHKQLWVGGGWICTRCQNKRFNAEATSGGNWIVRRQRGSHEKR